MLHFTKQSQISQRSSLETPETSTLKDQKGSYKTSGYVHSVAALLSAGQSVVRPLPMGLVKFGLDCYSHSMVPGGLLVMSSATRFTPGTSLMILLLTRSNRSYGSRAQSAVIASSLVTARMTTG